MRQARDKAPRNGRVTKPRDTDTCLFNHHIHSVLRELFKTGLGLPMEGGVQASEMFLFFNCAFTHNQQARL